MLAVLEKEDTVPKGEKSRRSKVYLHWLLASHPLRQFSPASDDCELLLRLYLLKVDWALAIHASNECPDVLELQLFPTTQRLLTTNPSLSLYETEIAINLFLPADDPRVTPFVSSSPEGITKDVVNVVNSWVIFFTNPIRLSTIPLALMQHPIGVSRVE